jgi:hypothetical protein
MIKNLINIAVPINPISHQVQICTRGSQIWPLLFYNFNRFNLVHTQLVADSEKLASTLKVASELYESMGEVNKKQKKPLNEDLFKSIGKLLSIWGSSFTQQAGMVNENFHLFFQYYHKEMEPMMGLYKLWEGHKVAFHKQEAKLKGRKQKLFVEQNVGRWDLPEKVKADHTLDILCKNKALAFREMLPKVTTFFYFIINLTSSFRKQRNLSN